MRSAAFFLVLTSLACGDSSTEPDVPSNPATETFAASLGVNLANMTRVNADLYIQDVAPGSGTAATNGRRVQVVYSGYLKDGTKFDSNVGGSTFPVNLGAGGVIDGWELGLIGMRPGGKRKLVIGSNLGYGPVANGPIPANSTLVFDVEVVSVQ
jgi:FKBP-type peptidyl-prolyl cis-trans isomerase FkpA